MAAAAADSQSRKAYLRTTLPRDLLHAFVDGDMRLRYRQKTYETIERAAGFVLVLTLSISAQLASVGESNGYFDSLFTSVPAVWIAYYDTSPISNSCVEDVMAQYPCVVMTEQRENVQQQGLRLPADQPVLQTFSMNAGAGGSYGHPGAIDWDAACWAAVDASLPHLFPDRGVGSENSPIIVGDDSENELQPTVTADDILRIGSGYDSAIDTDSLEMHQQGPFAVTYGLHPAAMDLTQGDQFNPITIGNGDENTRVTPRRQRSGASGSPGNGSIPRGFTSSSPDRITGGKVEKKQRKPARQFPPNSYGPAESIRRQIPGPRKVWMQPSSQQATEQVTVDAAPPPQLVQQGSSADGPDGEGEIDLADALQEAFDSDNGPVGKGDDQVAGGVQEASNSNEDNHNVDDDDGGLFSGSLDDNYGELVLVNPEDAPPDERCRRLGLQAFDSGRQHYDESPRSLQALFGRREATVESENRHGVPADKGEEEEMDLEAALYAAFDEPEVEEALLPAPAPVPIEREDEEESEEE
ncbi:hypothetical protein LTR37_008016 [Vermiconidia calcicola]|uniref:Uncharacterized protein n=1 Tax=Vermiconidia calcicola TaxID=1690605 RepID=A0ACC3ND99_9PEZI|nr:hypothetical protein LTR37_008016 [Vermiconidia calcicola]